MTLHLPGESVVVRYRFSGQALRICEGRPYLYERLLVQNTYLDLDYAIGSTM